MTLRHAGAGREPGADREVPGGRSPRPASFDPERGDDGVGRR